MSNELGSYKLQLEQVEVSLAAEPGNADLLKLKTDLEELIKLQQELDQTAGLAETKPSKLTKADPAPTTNQKNYVLESTKNGTVIKKDWKEERERRKARAQKKEQRRKNIEEEQERDKRSWKSFNQKAINKNFKGMKRVAATGSSADGGRDSKQARPGATVSSRTTTGFGFTNRGNMDSLF